MGHKLDKDKHDNLSWDISYLTAVEVPGSAAAKYMDQLTLRKRKSQDSCSWKIWTLAQDSDLVAHFREMSHKHRKLRLQLTRWIVRNQSKPWWKFALHAGGQSAVFYWAILHFSEKVPKYIHGHELFLCFNTICFNNDLAHSEESKQRSYTELELTEIFITSREDIVLPTYLVSQIMNGYQNNISLVE